MIAWIDLTGLLPASQRVDGKSVPIAYDAQHDRLFVEAVAHLRDQGRAQGTMTRLAR